MKDALRIPDVEVRVAVSGSEIFAFAAWLDPDIHQGLQSVVGIDDPASTKAICAILQAAIQKAQSANWKSLDVLDALEDESGGKPPF